MTAVSAGRIAAQILFLSSAITRSMGTRKVHAGGVCSEEHTQVGMLFRSKCISMHAPGSDSS